MKIYKKNLTYLWISYIKQIKKLIQKEKIMDTTYNIHEIFNNNGVVETLNLSFGYSMESSQNNFDISREEDLEINARDDINRRNTITYNDYTIPNSNFYINNSKSTNDQGDINQDKNENNKNYKKRGRKTKIKHDKNENEESEQKIHSKFSNDNMTKKCKNIVLKSALESINKKIKEKYKNKIGFGKFKKELQILNQKNKIKSTANDDKLFLHKTLKEIFSDNISSRLYNYSETHNKAIIESLINDEDEEKRIYFNNLFNITFLEYLNYFISSETCNLNNNSILYGFKDFSFIKDSLIQNNGEYYVNTLIEYLKNFKEIINKKRSRNSKKKLKEKSNE